MEKIRKAWRSMTQEEHWNRFVESGSVMDYLAYREVGGKGEAGEMAEENERDERVSYMYGHDIESVSHERVR